MVSEILGLHEFDGRGHVSATAPESDFTFQTFMQKYIY